MISTTNFSPVLLLHTTSSSAPQLGRQCRFPVQLPASAPICGTDLLMPPVRGTASLCEFALPPSEEAEEARWQGRPPCPNGSLEAPSASAAGPWQRPLLEGDAADSAPSAGAASLLGRAAASGGSSGVLSEMLAALSAEASAASAASSGAAPEAGPAATCVAGSATICESSMAGAPAASPSTVTCCSTQHVS